MDSALAQLKGSKGLIYGLQSFLKLRIQFPHRVLQSERMNVMRGLNMIDHLLDRVEVEDFTSTSMYVGRAII